MKTMLGEQIYVVLKFGQVGKQIASTSNVPKCGAGEEQRRFWTGRVKNEVLYLIKKKKRAF